MAKRKKGSIAHKIVMAILAIPLIAVVTACLCGLVLHKICSILIGITYQMNLYNNSAVLLERALSLRTIQIELRTAFPRLDSAS